MSYYYPVIPAFVPPTSLNVTAISAQNNLSTLECWQIVPGFTTSSQAGTIGASILQLGNLANMSYSVIPPRFNASFHNAPTNQWVVFLQGEAHITLANSTQQAFIYGGPNGLVFAADTAAVSAKGHSTNYPSNSETIALQIPTGGAIPNHNVLHSGPCTPTELEKRSLSDLD